jgi:hypothetical protein
MIKEAATMNKKYITDDMQLSILNYIDSKNIDYKLFVFLSGGRGVDLLLQPKIDEYGEVVAITDIYSQDDSFLIHDRYVDDILWAMQELKYEYEKKKEC